MASNDSDTNFLKMQDLDVKCAIFFVLFTHNFHSHSSTVRFIHSYSWQKFSYSIWLVLSSPDTRHETRKTLNSVIYRMRKESEREMVVAMRLGFIEIELSQQNFVPPIGNTFLPLIHSVYARRKKVYPFFCSVHIFLINAALLLRSSIFDAKISHFAA